MVSDLPNYCSRTLYTVVGTGLWTQAIPAGSYYSSPKMHYDICTNLSKCLCIVSFCLFEVIKVIPTSLLFWVYREITHMKQLAQHSGLEGFNKEPFFLWGYYYCPLMQAYKDISAVQTLDNYDFLHQWQRRKKLDISPTIPCISSFIREIHFNLIIILQRC